MPTAMSAILTSIGEIVTAVTGYIGTVVTAIVAQPLLLIPIGVSLLGAGVGLVRKFMK